MEFFMYLFILCVRVYLDRHDIHKMNCIISRTVHVQSPDFLMVLSSWCEVYNEKVSYKCLHAFVYKGHGFWLERTLETEGLIQGWFVEAQSSVWTSGSWDLFPTHPLMVPFEIFFQFPNNVSKVIWVEVRSSQAQQSVSVHIVFYSSTNAFGLQFPFGNECNLLW